MLASSSEVSVVTTTYNAAAYVEESLRSILNQTFSEFEYLIIDDGSTDETAEIVTSYSARDNRIRFHSLETNRGPATARNIGIELATGKWIAILDSDDVALPTRLEQQLAYVAADPGIVLLGSACIEIDAGGHVIKTHHYPSRHSDLVYRLERSQAFPPHSSCLYNTHAVRRLGGFNLRFTQAEDLDLWQRLGETGKLASLPQPLLKIRKHSRNISHHNRGKTQIAMAVMANTCHFLRVHYGIDPSQEHEGAWSEFSAWVMRRLEHEGVYTMRQQWSQLRERYLFSSSPKPVRIWNLARGFAASKEKSRILKDKLFGSGLAPKLAKEWFEKEQHMRRRATSKEGPLSPS